MFRGFHGLNRVSSQAGPAAAASACDPCVVRQADPRPASESFRRLPPSRLIGRGPAFPNAGHYTSPGSYGRICLRRKPAHTAEDLAAERAEEWGVMKIGAVVSPVGDWTALLSAARAADDAGLDAVGMWSHYHSARAEWAYLAGWGAMGALAAATSRIKIVPMVLNCLHYEPGVLAKESSVLVRLSGGRFELGIGAGDWPESFAAWGRPFPPASDRLDRLEETVAALRELWRGGPVDFEGRHVRLSGAICSPPPAATPRVVVGVGGSLRTLKRAMGFADEVNVYAEPELVKAAIALADEIPARPAVSVFVDWSWANWPADPAAALRALAPPGIDRVLVSLGGADMPDRIAALAGAAATGGHSWRQPSTPPS
jgi:alkanesulfonate monooxygenase SsuD/methylene tetrahydromethanopterin reductase-like flavin-dependent oxidoreductase (luciferase family)